MKYINWCSIYWAIGLFDIAVSQKLPYNPTYILHDPRTKNISYIFLRPSNSINHQLVSLDYSTTLSASNISFDVISQNLPFSSGDATALIPSISTEGDLFVYTGFCGLPETTSLWRYQIPAPGSKTTGAWAQGAIHNAADLMSNSLLGTQFLTRAITFSTLADGNSSQSNIYVFGGMCPRDNATAATWQSAAHYSSKMLRLSPISDLNYSIDIASNRGSAVPEAGFSFTGLTPTYLNNSNIRTQKESFILIGGHNQNAFISMTQVAVWNLPEEAWNFVKVKMPSSVKPNPPPTGENSMSLLDSRSGHTAVLSEDGSKIIVFGGWVGDVSRAAEPQLAILSLGTGYGGSGDWEWSIPANQPSGNGIYGHGATLLPGNVMMIIGGSEITMTMKRATSPGIKTMFFNATSLSWVSNYTNPLYNGQEILHRGNSSLGVRLAVGLGLIAIAGIVLLCVGLKHKNKTQREDNVRGLAEMNTSSHLGPNPETRTIESGIFPWSNRTMNAREEVYEDENPDPQRSSRYETMDIGVYGSDDSAYILPPPKQTSLRTSYSRPKGVYQSMSFDNHGIGTSYGNIGTIHPIYEADENDEEEDNNGDLGIMSGNSTSVHDKTENLQSSDPFCDPHIQRSSSNHKVLSQNRKSLQADTDAMERDIKDWVTDLAEANIIMNSSNKSLSTAGHVSSSKRATLVAATTPNSVTGEEDGNSVSSVSSLTDKSQVASLMVVSRTASHSASSSIRSFIMGINPFNSANPATATKTNCNSANQAITGDGSPPLQTTSKRTAPGSAHSSRSGKSFRSAHTSVLTTSKEAEYLLSQPADMTCTNSSPPDETASVSSGSPSKSKSQSLKMGNPGWIGSLKKVFTTSENDSFRPNPYDLGCQGTETKQTNLSFDKVAIHEPRRTVSANGSLWRRKQGRSDWDDSNTNLSGAASGCSSSNCSSSGLTHKGLDVEDDWDIERAVENRLVQVMFTVPKERLRVVNQDVNEEKSEVSSGPGSISHMSVKALMRQSIKEISLRDNPEMGETSVDELADSMSEIEPSKDKGKQKLDKYGLESLGRDSPTRSFAGSDLSSSLDDQKKVFENSSSGSLASKLSSRKSRVLEIVERMESRP